MSNCEKCAAAEIVSDLVVRLLESAGADLRDRGMLARHAGVAIAIAEAIEAMDRAAKALQAVQS